jgi:hypothetical protein
VSKFSGGRRGGGLGRSGTVTVIETRVHRASARKAKVAFWLTLFIVGLLTMTVAASKMHPILALLLGIVLGLACGAVAWFLVRVWPVIRLIWWWSLEITLGLTLVYGWIGLADHTNLPLRLLAVGVLIGVPAALPWTRNRIIALAWCVIVRHRLRTCFAQFIVANQSGSLPLILLARPTTVGERVWIQLRPGLALPDLEARLDKIAVACWADRIVVDRASGGNAGFLRIDVTRRQALTSMVGSPLPGLVDPNTPPNLRTAGDVPTALDLPQVTDPARKPSRDTETPTRRPVLVPVTPPVPAAAGAHGEDVSDWI